MMDDLLRPLGPGPRPPVDGFEAAVHAGRRRRLRTLRTNTARVITAAAAIVAAVSPRLSPTTVTGLEPTRPVVPTERHGYAIETPSPGSTPGPARPAPPFEGVRDGGGRADDGRDPGYEPGTGPSEGEPGAPPRPGQRAPGGPGPGAPGHDPAEPPTGPGPGGDPPSSPQPTPTPTGQPSPQPTTQPPRSPSPTQSPEPEPIDRGMTEQSVDTCQSSEWCVTATATERSDGTWRLELSACRPASETTGELHFRMENEADFRIVRNGAEVWRWSVGQPDDDWVHRVTVDRWMCAVWTTRWGATDQAGYGVAAGEYRVEATSHATNLPARWWGSEFRIT